MHILRNFKIEELVDRRTFEKFGKNAQMFLRDELLIGLDELRDLIGRPLIINNWSDDGAYEWSGLRTLDCYTGAKWSAHRVGAGADIKCPTLSPIQLRDRVRFYKATGKLKTITRMEIETTSWTHLDCLWTGSQSLVEFKP